METQQNSDWTAVREAATSCLDATWSLVCWAEFSQDRDYDVDRASLHLAAIDRAGDVFKRTSITLRKDQLDSIARATVGEGPRPEFQYRAVSAATAHEATRKVLQQVLIYLETVLFELDFCSLDSLHEISTEELRETLPLLARMNPLQDVLYVHEVQQLRAWIDREWAAVSQGTQGTDPNRPTIDVVRLTMDGLGGRSLRFFKFIVGRSYKTYFEELRDESTVFTKADISDAGIETGIKDLIRDLSSIEAPYIVEWKKGDKWVRLDPKSQQGE